MLLRCAVLLLYLNVARTLELDAGLSKNFVRDVDTRYSLWPSIHNGVRLMRIYKREAVAPAATTLKPDDQSGAQANVQTGADVSVQRGVQSNAQSNAQSGAQSSAQSVQYSAQADAQAAAQSPPQSNEQQQHPAPAVSTEIPAPSNNTIVNVTEKPLNNKTEDKQQNGTASVSSTSKLDDKSKVHNTTETEPPQINLSDPGVLKRAFIVFGGFALLAAAYYFIIYRKKGNNNDVKNAHSSIDQNQFRYGVLQSDDKRSNMELSRVPLTMESDEDEDEDLEIFDLGQKKKSLSYINLEQHDEDIVLNDSRSIDMENLLVDIDDKNTDMINWSGNGSKSIL